MYYVMASSDTEKVASSIACGQFLIKLWTYLDEQQILAVFTFGPINYLKSALLISPYLKIA